MWPYVYCVIIIIIIIIVIVIIIIIIIYDAHCYKNNSEARFGVLHYQEFVVYF